MMHISWGSFQRTLMCLEFYDLTILDQVLQERGLPPVSGLNATGTNATDALVSSDTG